MLTRQDVPIIDDLEVVHPPIALITAVFSLAYNWRMGSYTNTGVLCYLGSSLADSLLKSK